MRISCESCGALYNLPDDKVRGRRAKVRCKKCRATIIVDGTSLPPDPDFDDDDATAVMNVADIAAARATAQPGIAAQPDATAQPDLGEDATANNPSPSAGSETADEAPKVAKALFGPADPDDTEERWTVNLNDEEQFDMTLEQIVDGWMQGLVTDDAYVWRDGMDDWMAIADVIELTDAINAAIDEEEASDADAAESPGDAPVSVDSAAYSVPEASVPEASAPEATTPSAGDDPTPLLSPRFGPPGAHDAPTSAAPRFFPSIEETKPLDFGTPAAPPRRARRGPPPRAKMEERGENSVLFSLDALKREAGFADENAPASERVSVEALMAPTPPRPNPEAAAPLIDVGASVKPPTAVSFAPPSVGPSSVSAGPAYVTTSVPPEPKGGALKMFAAIVLGGGILLAGYFLVQKNLLETQAGVSAAPTQVAATPEPTATTSTPSAASEATSTAEPDSALTAPTASASAGPEKGEVEAAQPDQKTDSVGAKRVTAKAPTQRKPRVSAKPSAPSEPATGTKAESPKSEPKPADDPPSTDTTPAPSQQDEAPPFNAGSAKAALKAAAGRAASCKQADGPVGVGKVQVTFRPSGRVSSANVVSGPFGGTTVGGCVAKTFRGARVPKFSGEPVTVSKSFRITE